MTIGRRTLLKGIAIGGAVGAASSAPRLADASESPHVKPEEVGMLYDTTLCVGCRACVTKCKEANQLPYDRSADGLYDQPAALSGTTKSVIQLALLGEGTWSFMKAQCMHCADPACVSVCMASALHRLSSGVVAYTPQTCVGCRYCQIACPFDVPKFEWSKALPKIVKCEMCRHRGDPKKSGALAIASPACAEVCPREAVVYGTIADLRDTVRRRTAASPERYNAKVYGVTDAGGTHVLYLTAKGVRFEDLGLPVLPDEPIPAKAEKVQHAIYRWFAAPTVLYGTLVLVIRRNRRKASAAPQGESEEEP